MVVLILKLFPQTLWEAQIPWFWALFEPPKITYTQLQALAENFLEVTRPCYRYEKVSSGCKLSNALTLVIIRQTQTDSTTLVQNDIFTSKKNTSFKNSILFECFGSKSDTLSMFCEQNFDNFRMICSKFHYFQTFWIETRYSINVLDQKKIHFECFANLSNVLSEHPTSFECFQQKSDTFQMFCVEFTFFSNVL